MTSEIDTTGQWFVETGQMRRGEVNVRQTAFYTGMQCEEFAEKMEAIFGHTSLSVALREMSKALIEGKHDGYVEQALHERPAEVLDGDADFLWVTIGSMVAQGADAYGAYQEVMRANWDKRWGWPDKEFHKNEHGKILKPDGWRGPDLTRFLHPSLLQAPA
jgi:predicted HAD superfamily Cof-like phosphohydrolase